MNVRLRKMSVREQKDIDDMIAMGMKDAFDGNKADFSKMSAAELYVGVLQQFTYINVDEEGTEAAAVTVGGMLDSAVGLPVTIPFYVDSPFAFMIKEKSTGAILFMGKVTKL